MLDRFVVFARMGMIPSRAKQCDALDSWLSALGRAPIKGGCYDVFDKTFARPWRAIISATRIFIRTIASSPCSREHGGSGPALNSIPIQQCRCRRALL